MTEFLTAVHCLSNQQLFAMAVGFLVIGVCITRIILMDVGTTSSYRRTSNMSSEDEKAFDEVMEEMDKTLDQANKAFEKVRPLFRRKS